MIRKPTHDTDQNQQLCCVCGAASPITQTNYTLISPKHQWRMELRTVDGGGRAPFWYCPTCWQAMKRTRSTQPKKDGG